MRCTQMVLPALFSTLCMFSQSATKPVGAQGPPDTRSPRTILLTSKLFLAITNNDDAALKAALKGGSDPNGRNWLGFTPLMWASDRGRQSQVEYLLAHGAKLNDPSPYGTALSFALHGRHEEIARYLLSKGASTHSVRVDGTTPMMYAAANGYSDLIRTLVQRKENANGKDIEGDTALVYAARAGQAGCVKTLLAAGAAVDLPDRRGRTALMEASANGRSAAVDLLLSAHASTSLRDRSGNTALLLAARYSNEPRVVDALVKHGASPTSPDKRGNSPLTLAIRRHHAESAERLRLLAHNPPTQSASASKSDVHLAVQTSIGAIQGGMKRFAELARCSSCHHQGLGLMALGLAADRGIRVDGALIGAYMKQLGDEGKAGGPAIHNALAHPELVGTIQAVDIGDMPIGAGYLLAAMQANHVPANPGMAESAQLIAGLQKPDGRWVYGMDREPMQSSHVTTTALVINVLKEYGSPDPTAHISDHLERAKQWLLKTNPSDAEGRAMRLLGLKWSGASENDCAAAAKELLALQHGDGGWSQLGALPCDAYATGIALYALHIGGAMPVESEPFVRGTRYLVNTQDEDGTWFVNKRTNPSNNYFDAGFPHGESQYASFAGTCWAAMALLQTIEPKLTAVR